MHISALSVYVCVLRCLWYGQGLILPVIYGLVLVSSLSFNSSLCPHNTWTLHSTYYGCHVLTRQLFLDCCSLNVCITQIVYQEFPMACVGINITGMVLGVLRSRKLNAEINRRESVFTVVNEFYAAAWYDLYLKW